jgi:uncharacterized protein YbaP (TraB family)
VPEQFDFSRVMARCNMVLKRSRRLGAALALTALVTTAWPAAVSAVPATAPVAAAAQPGPALWVIGDADTTIYLFGTFHALDGRSAWFNRGIRAAFDASDQLVLETLVPEDPAELHAVLTRNALASEPKVGEPVIAADKAPSFVASAGQAMSAGRSMGMSVDHGADAVLRRAANAAGKPVGGLETFEFQLRMFGSLPAPARPAGGRAATGTMRDMLAHMQSAWARGDNASFATILGNVQAQSPATYKTMFVDRNANWAGWIANRMEQPGTVFVAVGTGHLIGSDSVQAKLAERGITSARIS